MGPTGPRGPTGPTGPQGDPGDTGPIALALVGRIDINTGWSLCQWNTINGKLVPNGMQLPSLSYNQGTCTLTFAMNSGVKWATAQSDQPYTELEVNPSGNPKVNVTLWDGDFKTAGTAYIVVYRDEQ